MKNITDDDLVLLYYGEHENPRLAAMVAATPQLQARFDQLCSELDLAQAWEPPQRDESYGAEVWQRIAPQLADNDAPGDKRLTWWWSGLGQPRFSLAGVLGLVLVAVVAYTLGRQDVGTPGLPVPLANPVPVAANDTGAGTARLLAHSVSNHLEQVDQVLTQFSNSSQSSAFDADWATDMLVANRLYRRSASQQGNRRLADFLAGLEPLLIELAYEAQNNSPLTRQRMQQEVKDGLLLRVRLVNQQLQNSQTSI